MHARPVLVAALALASCRQVAQLDDFQGLEPVELKGVGETCVKGECAGGLLCTRPVGSVDQCFRSCTSDADCGAQGSLCVVATGSEPGYRFCSLVCEPLSSAGCPPETKCDVSSTDEPTPRYYTECTDTGLREPGEQCATDEDCVAGAYCGQTTTLTCIALCDINAPTCPGTEECLSFSPPLAIGSREYGGCK